MLKLGCTLPCLGNTCLHKSTTANFYPFTESDKDLLEKLRADMVDGPAMFLQGNRLWRRFSFGIGETEANPSSVIVLLSFTLSLCV